ncbi:hypothetical protein LI134_11095, partial [Streptococcus parasanguinis]|uniref:hypothetical protein n=1 Tax=Streptococcus parasanguinis TaxID=1318 RepID=UPI001D06C907
EQHHRELIEKIDGNAIVSLFIFSANLYAHTLPFQDNTTPCILVNHMGIRMQVVKIISHV